MKETLDNNPLPLMIEALPDTLTILDFRVLDTLIDIVFSVTGRVVTNNLILYMLSILAKHDYILLKEVKSDLGGTLILVRKIQ